MADDDVDGSDFAEGTLAFAAMHVVAGLLVGRPSPVVLVGLVVVPVVAFVATAPDCGPAGLYVDCNGVIATVAVLLGLGEVIVGIPLFLLGFAMRVAAENH
jgi:hypothetical protein